MTAQSQMKKMQDLQIKMQTIHAEYEETQKKLAENLVKLIPQTEAFSIPHSVLIGGILHAVQTYKATPQLTEVWQKAGELFLKKISRKQTKAV